MNDSHTTKPNRRWLRYSLRAMLVFVLLLSVPLGWFSWKMQKAKRQWAAEQAISDSGGSFLYSHVLYDPPGPEWLRRVLREVWVGDVELVSMGPEAADADLAHLEPFTELKCLSLSDTQITDAGLEQLAGLNSLQQLRIGGTRIGDGGLAHLKALRSLQRLDLDGTRITDAGLQHLETLSSLDWLSLIGVATALTGMFVGTLATLQTSAKRPAA